MRIPGQHATSGASQKPHDRSSRRAQCYARQAAFAAVLTCFGVLSMGTSSAQQSPRDAASAAAQSSAEHAYKVGPEDVLEVSVWKEEALKKDVLVRPDGGLSFPLVGDIQASGRSIAEIRAEISKRLERFIPDPVVSVAVSKIASQRIYVIGKVNKPGDFPVGRSVDVLQALSMAGGLNAFAAANDIRIVRRDRGRSVSLPFQYSQVERGQRLEQNIELLPGDVVVVP